ncbi:MAG: helix-turn-helix transcriptional regulator [Nitrososphaera sp.]|nr:helix-turn-helix transcriptional regulator [Nitrososphaera sp.]
MIEIVYNSPELRSCPIDATFKIIGKKWTVLIVREILRGTKQFNRFLENIEGITPKVLTDRLRELQKFGIVKRRIVSEYPVRVEYEMTDLAKEFEPVLLAAASFSMRNFPKTVFKDGRPRNPADFLTQRQQQQ